MKVISFKYYARAKKLKILRNKNWRLFKIVYGKI